MRPLVGLQMRALRIFLRASGVLAFVLLLRVGRMFMPSMSGRRLLLCWLLIRLLLMIRLLVLLIIRHSNRNLSAVVIPIRRNSYQSS